MTIPRILAVIPARGGSKRLPGKNIRPLAGKPLIAWTVAAALAAASRLHAVIVSTDDDQIAAAARSAGAAVPFRRPPELSTDNAASIDVVRHACGYVEQRDNVRMDWVLLLQPTSPLRTGADIAAALDLAAGDDCDSVVAVGPALLHPALALKVGPNGWLETFMDQGADGIGTPQLDPAAWQRNGAIYLTRRDLVMNQRTLYGQRVRPYPMPTDRSVDIDTEADWRMAEQLIGG